MLHNIRPVITLALALALALTTGACDSASEDPAVTEPGGGGGAGGTGGAPASSGEIPEGPTHECASPPQTEMVARLDEGFREEIRTQLSALFYKGGALRSIDGFECTPGTDLPNPHVDRAKFAECFEAYTCGDCPFWVMYDEDDDLYGVEDQGVHYLAGEFPDDPDAVRCPEHLGLYRVIDPDAVTQPDADNAKPASRSNDICSDCLSSCQGVPGTSCCTGKGCLCEDECRPAPSDCSGSSTFCCGPYGDCICLSNCPY